MARNNQVKIKGDVMGDIYYDIFTTPEGKPVQFLRFYVALGATREAKELRGLRILAYGVLAELTEAHLQKSSRVLVEGHLQMRTLTDGKVVLEVVAEEIDYIRNIDWERGEKKYKELQEAGAFSPRSKQGNSFDNTDIGDWPKTK